MHGEYGLWWRKFTFEYKEASGDPAPFIAKGDKAKLYWYGPEHEVIPSDREDITYGTRLICLHNITTDNFYESRMCNEPGNVFKLSQKGGRDIYNHYSQCWLKNHLSCDPTRCTPNKSWMQPSSRTSRLFFTLLILRNHLDIQHFISTGTDNISVQKYPI